MNWGDLLILQVLNLSIDLRQSERVVITLLLRVLVRIIILLNFFDNGDFWLIRLWSRLDPLDFKVKRLNMIRELLPLVVAVP